MHLLKTKQETNLIDISQTPILIKYYTSGRTIIWDYSQRDNQGTAPNTGQTLAQSSFSSGLRRNANV